MPVTLGNAPAHCMRRKTHLSLLLSTTRATTDLQLLQAAPHAMAGGGGCCLLSGVPAGTVCLPLRKVKGNEEGCRNETMVAWAPILPLGPLLTES